MTAENPIDAIPRPRTPGAENARGRIQMLEDVGLDDPHVSIYRMLLTMPSADAAELARMSGLPGAHVERILDGLESSGFAARSVSDQARLVASPPALVLRPRLAEQERRLSLAHDALDQLSALYREGATSRHAPDVLDMVLGGDAVRQRIGQLQDAADESVEVFVLTEPILMASPHNIHEERALARGVRYRTIVETGVMERPGFFDTARLAHEQGEEVRVLPSLPTRLIMVDRELALLPLRSNGERSVSGALLVHPSGLLDLVISAFEQSWRAATSLLDASTDEDDAADNDLLRLLLLGMTDGAVSNQLGVSVRTVQRRVAELMERAGVSTRIQLGAAAVRLGWV